MFQGVNWFTNRLEPCWNRFNESEVLGVSEKISCLVERLLGGHQLQAHLPSVFYSGLPHHLLSTGAFHFALLPRSFMGIPFEDALDGMNYGDTLLHGLLNFSASPTSFNCFLVWIRQNQTSAALLSVVRCSRCRAPWQCLLRRIACLRRDRLQSRRANLGRLCYEMMQSKLKKM